jgi:hypothetical protein
MASAVPIRNYGLAAQPARRQNVLKDALGKTGFRRLRVAASAAGRSA